MGSKAVYMIDVAPAGAPAPDGGWATTVRRVSAGEPSLEVTDLGAARGDGVFETFGVVAGHPQAVDAHLTRLANSAALLDLPEPNADQWRAAIANAAAELPTDVQCGIKLVLTRGVEGTGIPTAWLTATVTHGDFAERRDGIRVVTLDRGYASDVAARAPWLLAGAKTLSYATNMAALREARRRGADDVIFVSSDGYVMEAPTSTVILRRGDTFSTPSTEIGILPGTSQLSLFEFFASAGYQARAERVLASELVNVDAAWLVSSVRLAVPITHVDSRSIPHDAELTHRMNDALLARDA
jgi:4-amino-4-deoxychorismate lyase